MTGMESGLKLADKMYYGHLPSNPNNCNMDNKQRELSFIESNLVYLNRWQWNKEWQIKLYLLYKKFQMLKTTHYLKMYNLSKRLIVIL